MVIELGRLFRESDSLPQFKCLSVFLLKYLEPLFFRLETSKPKDFSKAVSNCEEKARPDPDCSSVLLSVNDLGSNNKIGIPTTTDYLKAKSLTWNIFFSKLFGR